MISRAVFLASFFLLAACTYNNIPNRNRETALARVQALCHLPEDELQWLADLLVKAETDFSYKGPVYAIPYQDQTIIVFQPLIQSCLACRLYHCNGSLIEQSTVDVQKIIAGMNDSNLIFTPY